MEGFDVLMRRIEQNMHDAETVKCPACGHEHSGYDQMHGVNIRDGDEIEINCERCEAEITVRISITISYDVITDTDDA